MTVTDHLTLSWSDCFVLLNSAQFLDGEDIYALKACVSHIHPTSVDQHFDDVVKQLVLRRLQNFDQQKNKKLIEICIDFIKQTNKAKYIKQWNQYYWIYDMIGAKEPALDLIDSSMYNYLGKTDWRRDDHRTFLTTEIFLNGNIFLIINILQFIKIKHYSLIGRYGSSVNQRDKILLKLVLSFGKTLKSSLRSEQLPMFNVYTTKFLEFAYFYLNEYISYVQHPHFLHKLLNRSIYHGHIQCVEMLRKKCKAPILIHPDSNILFEGEQRLFQTFQTAQYCMNIWSLMMLHLHFDINLILCLKVCYAANQIEEHEMLDMNKLQAIHNYFGKPVLCGQQMQYDKDEELLSFFRFIEANQNILKDRRCTDFVDEQIKVAANRQ